MASIKFLNSAGKYQDSKAREDVLKYIVHPNKTPSHIIGGIGIDLKNSAQSMAEVAAFYKKDTRVRLHHFVLSFFPKEVYTSTLIRNVAEMIRAYIGNKYQIVYAAHEDTAYPHIHFVFNAVSYIDGHKYRGNKEAYYDLLHMVHRVLQAYGIATLISIKNRTYGNDMDE